jgi:cell wall-associated NlpC family hydrolase
MSWEVSISAVVGRIDQIIQLQQQMLDPASLAGSSATSAAGSTGASFSTGTSGTGTSTDFASQLASAQAAASPVASASAVAGSTASGVVGSTASGVVGASGGVGVGDPRVAAMVNEANSLVGKPYVYGGGHSGWAPQTGYDCSGFVSAVLHAGGYLTSPVDTTALPSQPGMVSGPGQYVTVYDRALPGQNGHVIIEINGQFYESGGMHGAWGGGGGVQKIGTPSASYLATFPTVLHPDGL